MKKVKIDVVYVPVTKRYQATCPECGKFYVRAKREAALHNLSLHLAYDHDAEVSR
jgi:hypothetical protein